MRYALKYLGIGAAMALAGAPALAGAHTYNTKVQTIRCGVLLDNRYQYDDGTIYNSTVADGNHAFSYVFHALNSRPDIRPYSWDIVNPYAAPYMDASMAARFGIAINANNPPRLNRNVGAYWEVFLHDVTQAQLSSYDVLYYPAPQAGASTASDTLTVNDREKLRRAVDAGTILWIDNGIGATMSAPSGQYSIVQPSFGPGNGRPMGDPMNALLSTPNPLSAREIAQLGARGSRATIYFPLDIINAPAVQLPWITVAAAGGKPVIAVAQYGQGAIVVTSRAIGRELSTSFRPINGVDDRTSGAGWRNNNTGPVSGSDASRVPVPELKLLINLIAFKFQVPQAGGGARHASGSRQVLNTPLGRKWQYPENFKFKAGGFKYAGVSFVSDPVVWNGICYAATSDGFLRAFDMDPNRDLDGDGNPDDGIQNPQYPSSDKIWEVGLPGPCSSLVIGDVNGVPRLFGMLSDGRVFGTDALPRKNGRLSGAPNIQAVKVNGFGNFPRFLQGRTVSPEICVPGEANSYRIPAPVWYNGRLFVVGVRQSPDSTKGIGAVAEINPATLQTKWEYPDGTMDTTGSVTAQGRLGVPSATPTVATIQDNGYSGATDIMLLVPTLSIQPSAGLNMIVPSRVVAFPLGVRGEKLLYNGDSDNKEYFTRFAGINAIQAVNVNVWVPGQSLPAPGTMQIDPRNGWNRMYVTATVPSGYDNDLRADYDFAPQAPAAPFVGYNARWAFDAWSYVIGSINKFMEILTTPVVSATGGIYFVASDVGDGANQAPIVMGVEMRPQNLGFNVTGNPNYMPPLNTPQLTFIYTVGSSNYMAGGACNSNPSQAQPVTLGTPAVDRGVLYVPYGDWRSPANSAGGVTGFFVQNTRFGLLLANPVDPNSKGSVQIIQRNLCTGDMQAVGAGQYDVDNVSIGNLQHGLLTFRSLTSGTGAGSLDLSRPGDIQVTYNTTDLTTGQQLPIQNETPLPYYRTERGEGSDPSILKAFAAKVPVTIGGGVRTGVTVAGGAIYVGSDSGEIWTVPLPTSLDVVRGVTTAPMRPATFPGLAAAAGFGYGSYPLDQNFGAALRSTPVVANGTLIENAPVGLYTFYSPRTLITDSKRIIEVASTYTAKFTTGASSSFGGFTPSGSEVIWSLDSTTQNREFGAPGAGANFPPWAENRLDPPVEKALNQPTMAIRVNSTNTLICDTGNNRVVEVDRAGNVVWQCTEFADPYGLLGPNESRTLDNPTSVQRWETWDYDENDNIPARSQHTLVADFGNSRILELVTRFSEDAADQLNNVVVWVGRGPAGKGYQFFQAQREPYYNPGDPNNGSLDYGRTIASVVNYAVNSAEVQADDPALAGANTGLPVTGGGSLVLLGGKKDTYGGGAKSASGKVVYFLSKGTYGAGSSAGTFPLARPVYFNRYTTGEGAFAWRVTMTDGQNVFELTKNKVDPPGVARIQLTFPNGPIVANKPLGSITQGMIGSGGYSVGTAMAKRLQNGNLLMVNQKTGYVFEFSPTAAQAGDIPNILTFTAPPIEGTAALTRPLYADRLF